MLEGKRILLVIGGGIAAYKVLELIRRLKENGATVRAVMTASAKEFVTPLSVAALTGEPVFDQLFDLTRESDIGHIRLSREADLVVVAPASANLIARMAAGMADDLATAVLLATDKPVLLCPAMNPRMWGHAATRRNVARLAADGVRILGPAAGRMAERGEEGMGRLVEPPEILAAISAFFGDRPLAEAGATVTLVSGPVAIPDPPGLTTVHVETAAEMLAATLAALPADIAVMAAAVADWHVAPQAQKIKKGESLPALELAENPDILATLGRHETKRPRLVVGFAAETENLLKNASAKLARKGADLIVANDVSPGTGVMGGAENTVRLVSAAGVEDWPRMAKDEVARRLVAEIVRRLEVAP